MEPTREFHSAGIEGLVCETCDAFLGQKTSALGEPRPHELRDCVIYLRQKLDERSG